ncbi:hypothetical protein RISK_006152 [Rhodopirellula islandica]|uniref:Uncharacterized protein n=1 Tax=Rhodopirellula islandica TaxID=595434 RepID=A0A0J1B5V0_RHOIS|nr:hypothetical protein [Rhodopirellula islandica]KLU01968.1 hypothetical protein RISK_006152 [Rhodopirellula islandica]
MATPTQTRRIERDESITRRDHQFVIQGDLRRWKRSDALSAFQHFPEDGEDQISQDWCARRTCRPDGLAQDGKSRKENHVAPEQDGDIDRRSTTLVQTTSELESGRSKSLSRTAPSQMQFWQVQSPPHGEDWPRVESRSDAVAGAADSP